MPAMVVGFPTRFMQEYLGRGVFYVCAANCDAGDYSVPSQPGCPTITVPKSKVAWQFYSWHDGNLESFVSSMSAFPKLSQNTRRATRVTVSPKGFFEFLRSHSAHLHRVFAKWLHDRGFEIRWVCKRENRGVWNIHLLRGKVLPGSEDEAAREVIAATLNRCGVDCPKREIEVSVIGNRVGAAFIFERGTPGSLVFSKGRDSWCADAWP